MKFRSETRGEDMKKTLPKKPSKLLTVALEDMGKARRSRKYILDMEDWHVPGYASGKPCEVCVAGAVMALRLGADPKKDYYDDDFGPDNGDRLCAIDLFRNGAIRSAFESLSTGISPSQLQVLRDTWHKTMEYPERDYRKSVYYWRRFIKKLKELGH